MTVTPAEQPAIISKESEWIDHSFSKLDLSAFLALNELPAEPKHDDRFAREYGDCGLSRSASALRSFVADPDAEALAQIGEETNNPGLLRDVRDQAARASALKPCHSHSWRRS
jgi:hypothetical protein